MRWVLYVLLLFPFFGLAQNTTVITQLPSSIEETSGLLKLNNRYYTFNDSANTNELYEFDTSNGSIIRTITISNTNNVDWEAIAADDTHVYIGDIGNYTGERTNLRIHKIAITDLEGSTSITAITLNFSYDDQTDFTPNPFNTNFDAEALIATNSNLYIFTKNWIDQQSNIYQLDKTSASQTAINVGSLASNGLVTAAYFDATDQEITFCGYNTANAFVWRLTNYTGSNFTSGQLEQFTLTIPATNSPQIEGITEDSEDVFYISAELLATRVPTLYSVDFNTLDLPSQDAIALRAFPNPATTQVYFNQAVHYELYNITGALVLKDEGTQLDIANLATGLYVLKLASASKKATIKLIKRAY